MAQVWQIHSELAVTVSVATAIRIVENKYFQHANALASATQRQGVRANVCSCKA